MDVRSNPLAPTKFLVITKKVIRPKLSNSTYSKSARGFGLNTSKLINQRVKLPDISTYRSRPLPLS
ncbi:hypothetical protein MNBD_GAMMA07-936 [hydrothermal vent metagenome]|uniref:Uncharacterized protein n=1 Tax=hydrothermal vent metagenome TaxID=652676 RepID=A0A3B0WJH0_9ZZZZ